MQAGNSLASANPRTCVGDLGLPVAEAFSAPLVTQDGFTLRRGWNRFAGSGQALAVIKELQKSAVFRNPNMAAAHLVGAQAEAMKSAAANEGSGAFMAFAGLNMAQGSGGMNAQNLFNMGAQQPQQPQPSVQAAPPVGSWTCACGAVNTGKFCTDCAKPKPQDAVGWTCPKCGTVNKGKFCMECSAPKPSGVPQYKCDKCGWEPKDLAHPPKFCPECGDPFDDGDIK